MASEKPTYLLLDRRETLGQSIVSDLITFGFLLLCIWASQGSTWWTFFTGVLFLLFGVGKIAAAIGDRRHKFKSAEELRNWADSEMTKGA